MWFVNVLLLILGTVSAITGISFYVRNKEASGNIRFYILSYGLTAALWCDSFGMIGICSDFLICDLLRKAGILGVDTFLLAEAFLVTDMAGLYKKARRISLVLIGLLTAVDFFIFSVSGLDVYVREKGRTTWYANPEKMFPRNFHSFYIVVIFLFLFLLALVWLKNNKLKRLRHFLFMVFVSNFLMLFFTFPDTYLPTLGKAAISTSGIGASLCEIVMWYGALQLNSFDIRTGNMKERIFEFLEAGIVVFDTDRKVSLNNRYAERLMSTGENKLPTLTDFFDITEEGAEKMFAEARSGICSDRLRDRAGVRSYSVRMKAVEDSYGDLYCYMCVFMDITEEVEAAARLQIASRAKSRFLAQMSHEIRTPINAVLGMNEMILRESTDREILDYASGIDSAGNTLLYLINSILDFSKIEDGKMELVPVTYDTASLINDLYHSIIQRADAKGLAVNLSVDSTIPRSLIGDNVRVSQVIMNLLTNAVKYTEKGTVTLTIREEKREGEMVYLKVSVQDTGIGIREEDREKLFESFERLDEVRNHNIEGTGLGISIVTSLLEMMGSRLSLESKYGAGSLFYFTISQKIADSTPIGDLEERMKEVGKKKAVEDVIRAPGAKVLLVDDNDMNLKVAKNLLKLCAIIPDTANSGRDTIRLMKEHAYDIVFLDHMMPGMDGLETLQCLSSEGLLPERTAMIALTANAIVGAREMYVEAGFTDYLSKPIEIRDLVQKLKQYLPKEAYDDGEPLTEDAAAEKKPGEETTPAEELPGEEEEIIEFSPKGEEIMEFMPSGEEIMEFGPEGEEEPDFGAPHREYDRRELEQLDLKVDEALSYCAGDWELYGETLEDFAVSEEEKSNTMEDLYRKKDWKEYEVYVHALKSNARLIGASELSRMARELEEASGREDEAFITGHHEETLQRYRELAGKLRG